MALINCPNCGREISDKAKTCIGCGFQFDGEREVEKQRMVCPECGAGVEEMKDICENCGYPMQMYQIEKAENTEEKTRYKKKWIWILAVCLCIVILAGSFVLDGIRSAKYDSNIRSAVDEIMEVSAKVETIGNQVCSVWNNAIFDKENEETAQYTSNTKDFNEALSNLFADEKFLKEIDAIRTKQISIDEYLGKLKNPPRRFEEAYDEFKELYYDYSAYTDFVISCKGSYNSYSEKFFKKSSELMESFRELKVLLLSE